MGDGTGCDNMTAVIAKLKPNAFSNKKQAGAQSESAAAVKNDSSNLTEKEGEEKVKLESESSADSVKPETEAAAAKRPAGSPQEPQAKKAKTDNAATETSQDSSKKAETKTEPETAA